MAIIVDGSVDSPEVLKSTGEDSNGKKLDFKQQDDGSFVADGSDGKRYSIIATMAKVSVGDIPTSKDTSKKK